MKRKKPVDQTAFAIPDVLPVDEETRLVVARYDELLREVKPQHRWRLVEVIAYTDVYCLTQLKPLDVEYCCYCRRMAAAMCKAGSPMMAEKASPLGWAAAIVATVGWVNFLSDPDVLPCKSIAQVAAGYGVSEASIAAKSRTIRERLRLNLFEPFWTVPGMLAHNPVVWMAETSEGFLVDARTMPRNFQVAAFEAMQIPWVPADNREVHEAANAVMAAAAARREAEKLAKKAKGKSKRKGGVGRGGGDGGGDGAGAASPPHSAKPDAAADAGPSLFDVR